MDNKKDGFISKDRATPAMANQRMTHDSVSPVLLQRGLTSANLQSALSSRIAAPAASTSTSANLTNPSVNAAPISNSKKD